MRLRAFVVCVALGVAPLLAQRGGGAGRGGGPAGVPGGFGGNGAGQGGSGRGASAESRGDARMGGGPPGERPAGSVTDNPGLSKQLQKWLPAGQTLGGAAAGFESQGQFVAALHVSRNLNIPFDQLKGQMTGPNAASLGKAIQKLRPEMDGKAVKEHVRLAERQTERDFDRATMEGKPDRVAERVTRNEQLAARLNPLLPAGTTLGSAAAGFKNEGQFIATLHVAKNLGVPFEDLKDRVTAGQPLGAAIHDLKPALSPQDIETGVKTAEEQAKTLK